MIHLKNLNTVMYLSLTSSKSSEIPSSSLEKHQQVSFSLRLCAHLCMHCYMDGPLVSSSYIITLVLAEVRVWEWGGVKIYLCLILLYVQLLSEVHKTNITAAPS